MDKKELPIVEIRDLAFRTTDLSHNTDWMSHQYVKITSSKFRRAMSVIMNHHSTNIKGLRDDIYATKNLDHVPAIRLWIDHEWVAMDAYQNMTRI